MPDRQTTPRSFELALAEFEALVEKMERGDLSLEESVAAYERGVVLHRYCEEALSVAERKIRILTEGPGEGGAGERLQPFGTETEDSRPSHRGDPAARARAPERRRPPAGGAVPEGDGFLP